MVRKTSTMQLAAGRDGQALEADQIAVNTVRWVEHGDRSKAAGQDPRSRNGHMFLGFEAKEARDLWHGLLEATVKELSISTIKVKDDDLRTVFTVSLSTDFWQGLSHTPQERCSNFLELISYAVPGEFPSYGTEVAGSFMKKADPDYTVVIIRASEAWVESAHDYPVLRTSLGTLRLYQKTDKDLKKDLKEVDDVANDLAKTDLHQPTGSLSNTSAGDTTTTFMSARSTVSTPAPAPAPIPAAAVVPPPPPPPPATAVKPPHATPSPAGLNNAPPLPAPPAAGPLKGSTFTIPRIGRPANKSSKGSDSRSSSTKGAGSRSSSTSSGTGKRMATSPALGKTDKKADKKTSPKVKQS